MLLRGRRVLHRGRRCLKRQLTIELRALKDEAASVTVGKKHKKSTYSPGIKAYIKARGLMGG